MAPHTQTPQTTQLIDIDGRKIAFHTTPGTLPTIVLDAGGGLDSSHWDAFVPELSRRTGARIITYDRPGFGASDEVPGPWSLQSAADDLAAGLQALGATRQIILVSHSIAGEIATALALKHPGCLSGLVLVDANVPDFFTDEVVEMMSAAYAPVIAAIKASPPTPAGKQLLAVSESFVETSRAFHGMALPVSVPATTIVAAHTPFDEPAAAQVWRDAHARFASGASNRTLVVAEGSSHNVAHDRPDVILQAIEDMIAHTRPGDLHP